jgi:hypothetical protein
MASKTAVRRPFAGQERTFDLRIGEIMALERACEAGIFGIVHRLASHHGRLADIRETIRLGLMGGSDMPDAEATRLVMDAVDGRPLSEALPLAAEILNAVINGLPEPEQQEGDGGGNDASGKELAESRTPAGSPPITGTAS